MAGVSVAVSGGGHRASLFALGVLMYLADSGQNRHVTSIASVSGGSLTNGVVAQGLHYPTTGGRAFRAAMTGFAHRLAAQGTLQGRPMSGARRTVLLAALPALVAALVTLRFWVGWWPAYAAFVGASTLALAVLLYPLFATGPARVYVTVLLVTLLMALVTPWGFPAPARGLRWVGLPVTRLGLFVAAIVAWGWVVHLRGRVCAAAYRTTLFSPGGTPTALAHITGEGIDHVFCASELQSAEQVYFGKDFIYGYRFGKGRPAGLGLHDAVHASANLPFAFPPRWLPTRGHGFAYPNPDECPDERDRPRPYPPRYMVLSDGGVYDNMADQWAQGFVSRARRCWPALREEHHEPEVLIVANASAGLEWEAVRRARIPLFGEMVGLLKVKDVLYDQTTAHRRSGLVGRFARAELEGSGLRGALLNIPQSPYTVPDAFREKSPTGPWKEHRERAEAVISLLGDDDTNRYRWARIAREDAAIPTVLSAIGEEESARLLQHAYVLAMANLHVMLGYPLPETLPPAILFAEMVRGVAPGEWSWEFTSAAGRTG